MTVELLPGSAMPVRKNSAPTPSACSRAVSAPSASLPPRPAMRASSGSMGAAPSASARAESIAVA
jgi:hypothetical protein